MKSLVRAQFIKILSPHQLSVLLSFLLALTHLEHSTYFRIFKIDIRTAAEEVFPFHTNTHSEVTTNTPSSRRLRLTEFGETPAEIGVERIYRWLDSDDIGGRLIRPILLVIFFFFTDSPQFQPQQNSGIFGYWNGEVYSKKTIEIVEQGVQVLVFSGISIRTSVNIFCLHKTATLNLHEVNSLPLRMHFHWYVWVARSLNTTYTHITLIPRVLSLSCFTQIALICVDYRIESD